jgi:hypothetical protein
VSTRDSVRQGAQTMGSEGPNSTTTGMPNGRHMRGSTVVADEKLRSGQQALHAVERFVRENAEFAEGAGSSPGPARKTGSSAAVARKYRAIARNFQRARFFQGSPRRDESRRRRRSDLNSSDEAEAAG